MLSGAICGCGGGPPCETFSAARLLDDGPPPLRSYDFMHGLPWNRPKAWPQVHVGSELMRFLLQMLLLAAQLGACGFLEHPAFPTWAAAKRPASIWSSKVIRWLRRLACTNVITVDQCLFGCLARKPTTLLLIRMEHLVRTVHSLGHMGRCNHGPRAHVALQGLDDHGAFRTSIAKVYPCAFNQAIADAVIYYVIEHFPNSQRVEPLDPFLAPLRSFHFVDAQEVQPDYYR